MKNWPMARVRKSSKADSKPEIFLYPRTLEYTIKSFLKDFPRKSPFPVAYKTLTCVSSILLGGVSLLLPKAHAFHLPQEENHVLEQAKDEKLYILAHIRGKKIEQRKYMR